MAPTSPTRRPTEPDPGAEFVEYLEAHLARRDWSVYDFCDKSGLKPSVVFRWKKGFRPDIGNSRLVAHAFHVPLLEVLVKAGRLSPEEADAHIQYTPELSAVPIAALMNEVNQRIRLAEPDLDRVAINRAATRQFISEDSETEKPRNELDGT